jgi:hypothetical protein
MIPRTDVRTVELSVQDGHDAASTVLVAILLTAAAAGLALGLYVALGGTFGVGL